MKINSIYKLLSAVLGSVLIGGALVVPRAYSIAKLLVLIALLLVLGLSHLEHGGKLRVTEVMRFFFVIAIVNVFAMTVGVIYGNPDEAIVETLRLGIIYPIIFSLLWTFFEDFGYDRFIQRIVIVSAFGSSLLIMSAVIHNISGFQFLPQRFVDDNLLIVGLHDGYLQVIAQCVGSLFFLSGYLLYYVVAKSRDGGIGLSSILALAVTIIAAMLSGRRALQLLILIFPVMLIVTSILFFELNHVLGKIIKTWSIVVFVLSCAAIYLFATGYFVLDDAVERFSTVLLSDEEARLTQSHALFAGFLESPLLGAGVGASVEVIRSEDWPWHYELTYLQFLFQYGAIASLLVFSLFMSEFRKVRYLSQVGQVEFSLEVRSAFCGALFLLAGAITNPYLSSFEPMLFLGIIPFVAGGGGSMRRQISGWVRSYK